MHWQRPVCRKAFAPPPDAWLGRHARVARFDRTRGLFDKTPLGILDRPNVATDVIVHLAVAAVSVAVLVVQLRRDRGTAPQPA